MQVTLWWLQVDQPMCHDCAHRVQDEVEVSIKEAQRECAAYEVAIKRLAEEDLQPLTHQVTAHGLCSAYHITWFMACLY